MPKNSLWTQHGLRLKAIKSQEGFPYNWLFFPGGPGLGSESLVHLVDCLHLPGTLWLCDYPGDGSNTTSSNTDSFKNWPLALEEIAATLDHVIFVCHSTGGMFALSLPILEEKLRGLVLIASAPDSSWQQGFQEAILSFPIKELEEKSQLYRSKQDNQNLKALTLAALPHLFTKEGMQKGRELLETLPYNYETCLWAEKNFDTSYRAQWVPQQLPTLILAGEKDLLTPLSLFEKGQNFHRKNITLQHIAHAGHFPWIENPEEVRKAFERFLEHL